MDPFIRESNNPQSEDRITYLGELLNTGKDQYERTYIDLKLRQLKAQLRRR